VSGVRRRDILAALASFGAATGHGVAAEKPAIAGKILRAVDVHHHHTPLAYLAASKAAPRPMRNWSAAASLDRMDRFGVATAIFSIINQPDIWMSDDREANRRLARQCNEYSADLVRDHPGRFGLFACVPLPDIDGSVAEIAYSLDVLKADGIGLFTSYGGKWLGDSAFAPLLEELDRRRTVAYVHPYAPSCCAGLLPGVPDNFIEYAQDTARAITSLLLSGTLARHRRIRWIFSHAGGPIPALSGRLATLAGPRFPHLSEAALDGIAAELRRLHYDTANAAYPAAMDALLDTVLVSQVLFGTDYPYIEVADDVSGFSRLQLSAARRHAIAREMPSASSLASEHEAGWAI
jgi:predicted TIM-barrel fold metal-dependent hydrolase